TSRLLVVGPDTATGLISALTVGGIAVQGTAEFNALTSTLAILIGAFFLLFGALRMGWVAAFIPTPVMRDSSRAWYASPSSARCRICWVLRGRPATFSQSSGPFCSN